MTSGAGEEMPSSSENNESDTKNQNQRKTRGAVLPSRIARAMHRSPIPPPMAETSKESEVTYGDAEFDWKNEEHTLRFANDLHNEIQQRRSMRQSQRLKSALLESRDKVLEKARLAVQGQRMNGRNGSNGCNGKNKNNGSNEESGSAYQYSFNGNGEQLIYPRLPSNACAQPPKLAHLLCWPCSPETPEESTSTTNAEESSDLESSATPQTSSTPPPPPPPPPLQRKGIKIKVRGAKNKWTRTETIKPILFLEGTHQPRPLSTTTIFLKSHHVVEDMQNLTFVPWFGDDDKEDVVSELYDIEEREKMMEFGPEYQERNTNDAIDEVLYLLVERLRLGRRNHTGTRGKRGTKSSSVDDANATTNITNTSLLEADNGTPNQNQIYLTNLDFDNNRLKIIQKHLATIMNVNAERITKRLKHCFSRSSGSGSNSTSPTSSNTRALTRSRSNRNISHVSPNLSTKNRKRKLLMEEDDISTSSSSSSSSSSLSDRNSILHRVTSYESVADSFRNLFCRRCFTYDCNLHGNLTQPNVDLQGELAVQKELEGGWADHEPLPNIQSLDTYINSSNNNNSISSGSSGNTTNINDIHNNGSTVMSNNIFPAKKRARETMEALEISSAKETKARDNELTPLQKSICERAFTIFQGDIENIAKAMGSSAEGVARYVKEKGISLKDPVYVQQNVSVMNQRKIKKKGWDSYSMKNYNAAWLKRVQGAEIHPSFNPCNHTEPCSDESCSCVKNAFFCSKHCVWGTKGRNFFRGCSCKGNTCRTKSCSCFAANRECDPDLCRSCGACTDPPNRPAVNQRCRNDSIGMRRHCHLLLAESSIEDAGWGIYTKHALKKGDFVHEYVGEVISQEEAERRGRIYDKVNRSYLFNLSSDLVVDASRKGNKTKFANHSSKPNCVTKMTTVNGDIRIGLFAKEDIEPQSELFFDYRYDVTLDNDLIIKPGKTVDWMKNPKMANKISKKHA